MAGTLAVAICAGFVGAYVVVRSQLRAEIDASLATRAATVASLAHVAPSSSGPPSIHVTPPALGGAGGYIQFVESSGRVSLTTGERTRLPASGTRAVASGDVPAFYRDATVGGVHVRIYATRIDKNTAVEIARPLTELDHSLSRIRLLFFVVTLVAAAGAAVIGLAVARTVLRPVRRLTADAERIAATGKLDERTDEERSDELGRLARAFNMMLEALGRSVRSQRQLVTNASHELRTPLASARANLELVQLHESLSAEERGRLLADASLELREMTDLIDAIVALARAGSELPDKEPVRLDLLVEDAVATFARRTSTPIRTHLEPTLVEGAPLALTGAVANLIENAVKWSPAGAPVEVTVRDGTVTVRDHGPGVDAADVPYIFDRFYRAPAARSLPGSGLGLAIVRLLVEAHGGSVQFEPADGGGSRFTLSLPTVDTGRRFAAAHPPL
jgi:two-component system sensor histidine kinase MprB